MPSTGKIPQKTSRIGRNMKCPCGSGQKIKQCCKHLMVVRNKFVQDQMDFNNKWATHNRNIGKKGQKRLTRQEFELWLAEQELEAQQIEAQKAKEAPVAI